MVLVVVVLVVDEEVAGGGVVESVGPLGGIFAPGPPAPGPPAPGPAEGAPGPLLAPCLGGFFGAGLCFGGIALVFAF